MQQTNRLGLKLGLNGGSVDDQKMGKALDKKREEYEGRRIKELRILDDFKNWT